MYMYLAVQFSKLQILRITGMIMKERVHYQEYMYNVRVYTLGITNSGVVQGHLYKALISVLPSILKACRPCKPSEQIFV